MQRWAHPELYFMDWGPFVCMDCGRRVREVYADEHSYKTCEPCTVARAKAHNQTLTKVG